MKRAWLHGPVLGLLVACADWLFFGHAIGLSFALFLATMMVAVLLCGSLKASRRDLAVAIALAVAGLLPLIEGVSPLASLLAILALAHLALVNQAIGAADIVQRALRSCGIVLAGPGNRFAGLVRWGARHSRAGAVRQVGHTAILWTMPAAFSAVFIFLFASANPVIDNWLAPIRLDQLLAAVDFGRMGFWLLMTAFISPFIFPRQRAVVPAGAGADFAPEPVSLPAWAWGDAAILRSLAVFNLLFAVETVLDLRYLWNGAALPQGLTFADYAHRGAYPLMVTALLAGAFVIAAMKPGGAREHSPLIRALVFGWVAQNVLLVASSMLRLKLYVATYSLTYWRSAAFIWTFLVALGLILIVARIFRKQSNRWLVSANLITLGIALYACGFVNFAALIANYNVAQSREMGGTGQPLDLYYLTSLGPEAIPALDRYMARADIMSGALLLSRQRLAGENRAAMSDWRGWSLRGWRLAYYLRHHL